MPLVASPCRTGSGLLKGLEAWLTVHCTWHRAAQQCRTLLLTLSSFQGLLHSRVRNPCRAPVSVVHSTAQHSTAQHSTAQGSRAAHPELVPGVLVLVQLGGDGRHDVGLALDLLLPALDVLDDLLRVVQLTHALPEHRRVGTHLSRQGGVDVSAGRSCWGHTGCALH
jgi:hypothetical protein